MTPTCSNSLPSSDPLLGPHSGPMATFNESRRFGRRHKIRNQYSRIITC